MSSDAPGPMGIRDPWLSLLRAVDAAIDQPVELHAAGGFALGVLAGWPRPTGDIDLIGILPGTAAAEILELAGADSVLARKHRVHVEIVSVAEPPCDYAGRLIDVTPGDLRRLWIKLLEPHDLALTKLDRNSPRDRDDVTFMAERASSGGTPSSSGTRTS